MIYTWKYSWLYSIVRYKLAGMCTTLQYTIGIYCHQSISRQTSLATDA